MSFLNQLKSQASALQSQRAQQDSQFGENAARTEAACRTVLAYLQDLARQLNVIEPDAPALTLDGKTPWPPMKLNAFRVDARRKMLRDREVTDYIGVGWDIVPKLGKPVGGLVTVNFPPDLKRVEERLHLGNVKHERHEQRDPDKGSLRFIRFEYTTQARGGITVTPDHETGTLRFRVLNTAGFEALNTAVQADGVSTALLDELAKRVVGQPNRFA